MNRTSRPGLRSALDAVRYGRRYASARFARNYEAGKSFEGYRGGLLEALGSVTDLRGRAVADIGTGTGQLPSRLAGTCGRVYGIDPSPEMIRLASALRAGEGNLSFAVGGARNLPLPDATVDVAVFSWSLLSILSPHREDDWRAVLDEALSEAGRVLRPGGAVAAIETLNVDGELPPDRAWHPFRREFLRHLEDDLGFSRTLFANDWDFRTTGNLRRYGPIWFSRKTVRKLLREDRTALPESAGVWWRRR